MVHMSERSLLSRFREGAPGHPWVRVGPGQDCAILEWDGSRALAYKIDQVLEGVHFVLNGADAATPRQVGWKAMARACSDIAAAGCWPVAAHLRAELSDAGAMELYEGLTACCDRFGFALAGGDLASGGSAVHVVVRLVGEGPSGTGAQGGDRKSNRTAAGNRWEHSIAGRCAARAHWGRRGGMRGGNRRLGGHWCVPWRCLAEARA